MTDDHALANALRRLSALGERVEDRLMRENGVSLAQSRLLEVIQQTPRARWSDIEAVLGYSPRTITEALDVLERDALITRMPDPADRRAKTLTLTDGGRRGLAAAQVARDRVRKVIFGALTERERSSLLDMLDRISEVACGIDAEGAPNIPT